LLANKGKGNTNIYLLGFTWKLSQKNLKKIKLVKSFYLCIDHGHIDTHTQKPLKIPPYSKRVDVRFFKNRDGSYAYL